MANFAKVEIELTDTPIIDEVIAVSIDGSAPFISEIAKSVRSVPGQFRVLTEEPPETISLTSALNLDYIPGGFIASYPIVVTSNPTIVTIEAIEYGHEFDIEIDPTWATITITPEVLPDPVLEIDTITVSEADGGDKCANARYDFTVLNAVYPIDILTPVIKTAANAGELFFDYARFPIPQVTLLIEDDASEQASELLTRVSTYSFDSVGVLESFAGATVTLNTSLVNFGDVTPVVQFSLDDITYQSSNIFYGITAGSYTAYTLDEIGCKKSLPFTVVGVTVDKPEPIFNISNANSLKFWEDTEFSPCGNIPNFDNAPVSLQKYFNTEQKQYWQKVQQCDATTIQVRTNYETLTIEVLDCDGNVVQSPASDEKRTYINQKDKRDLKIKAGSSGKTHVYFPEGNLYIPDTLTVDGTYSNPTLQLPEYADDGTIASGIILTLSDNSYVNGDFLVNGKVYDEDINGWAFEIDAIYTSLNESEEAIGQSLYNEEDWNSVEFVIAWSILPVGNYYISVLGTDDDPRYEDEQWYSEPINNAVEQLLTSLITYTNSSNIELMDYSTGIINQLRVPGRFVKHRDGGEVENFDSDDGSKVQLRGTETDEVALEVAIVPQYLKKKISIASIHNNLTIEGQTARIVEKGEQEDLLADQNRFYKIDSWYQVGDALEIADGTGLTTSENVLGAGGVTVLGA